MIRALYTATSGMWVRGTEQFDMLANNLANVGTPGFKAQYIHQISYPTDRNTVPSDVQVSLTERYENPAQGQFQHTGEDLDLALEGGKAFFTVETAQKEIAYTRNGHLRRNAQGWLLDSTGNRIMGSGGPLAVPPQTANIAVGADGTVSADGTPVGKLALVEFPEGSKPIPAGAGLFFAEQGKEPLPSSAPVMQGYFERSNVNVVEEMIRLVEAVRSMESYQKMSVAASDETTGQLVRQTGRVA